MLSSRKRLWIQRLAAVAALCAVILAVSLYTWIPGVIMSALNHPRQRGPYAATEPAAELHRSLTIADLHCDTLFWPRNLLTRSSRGLLDVPRLIEGNVALQCFSAQTYMPLLFSLKNTGSPPDVMAPIAFFHGWPSATWFSPRERALYMAGLLDKYAQRSEGRLTVIHMREDLERYLERRKSDPAITAGLLTAEGMYCLENDLENVRVLYHAGFRILAPAHLTDSAAGGSAHGRSGRGLTDFGAKVVRYMEQHKMLIDLAHASNALIDDVLALSARPVVVTHTGLKGIRATDRNLDDDRAKRIAEKGGLIGIGFWPEAVGGTTAQDIARSIRYAADLVGVDHVAIGSDFDGCVIPPFDASGLPLLTQALRDTGFTPEEIGKIMGGNFFRLLLQMLPSENDAIQQGLKE